MVNYTCLMKYSDPFEGDHFVEDIIEVVLPESTYSTVRAECFRISSEKGVDLPKELVKIDFTLLEEKIL